MPSFKLPATLMLMTLLFLSPSLSGCVHSQGQGAATVRPGTPHVPARYAACFNEFVQLPIPKGGWTRAKAVKAIAELQTLDGKKTGCGHGLIAWADGVLASVRGP